MAVTSGSERVAEEMVESMVTQDGPQEDVVERDAARKSLDAKQALRTANQNPQRPDNSFLRTLDSSIKRNTAVIKRLKHVTEEQREGLTEELQAVNLSKYVSEAVAAICEAKLKNSDIMAAVQVCSVLHQRYKEFSSNLVAGLTKVVTPSKNADDGDASSRLMRRRTSLRLLTELFLCSVYDDFSVLLNTLKDLTVPESIKDREVMQTNLSLLVSFARQTRELIGSSSDQTQQAVTGSRVSVEHRKNLVKLLGSYYDAVLRILHMDHLALIEQEKGNARILGAKGELSEESAMAYEKSRKSYEQLFRNVTSLAECLDKEPPVAPEDERSIRVTTVEESGASQKAGKAAAAELVWDDEETRLFYESLPDLRAFVPAVLLGEVECSKNESQKGSGQAATEDTAGSVEQSPKSAAAETVTSTSAEGSDEADVGKKEPEDSEKAKQKPVAGVEPAGLDRILQRLPSCVSRDLIDQLSVEFCYVNSKSNRKKLVRSLFSVPRTSLELIPYYARIAATLSTCMKDIAPMLLALLEEEFNHLYNQKDQINIEVKIRNIRFFGELAKFKLAPPGTIFSLLKACLEDFTHHNVDVVCNLLETCGRFLYRSPETSVRMSNMLDIMMRLKNHKNFDSRHSTLIENAYYQCKPPDRVARIAKALPPLHQYIQKLFADLEKANIEHVLRQLRKLPWTDKGCRDFVLKCLVKVYKGKYSQVHLMASLTAGLSRYHDDITVAVVDEVLESVRSGLEWNDFSQQQRRLAYMRFLGELYNYRVIDSPIIFDTLYLVLFFGQGTPEAEILDPPEDCFRIRMVIALLETCGQFFDRGSSKRRLDRFLVYFQCYVLAKVAIPLDIEFDLQDLFAELRTNFVRCTTYSEAHQAVVELEARELAATGEGTIATNANGALAGARENQNALAKEQSGQVSAHGSDVDSDSDAGSDSMEDSHGVHSEDAEDTQEDGEDGDDDAGESGAEAVSSAEEDDHVKVKHKEVGVTAEEDAEFAREFRSLMQESIESRKLDGRRSVLNMTIPMNLFERGARDSSMRTGPEHEGVVEGGASMQVPEGRVSFRVLVKKAGKQQAKQLQIPAECSLVQSTKKKEAEELEEKQDIKRLVLEYNSREEDERTPIIASPAPRGMHRGGPNFPGVPDAIRGSTVNGGQSKGRVVFVASNDKRRKRPVGVGLELRR